MKHLTILVLTALLFITACAGPRQKLSPMANVALRTANMDYNNKNIEDAEKNYEIVLNDRPDHAEALNRMGRIHFARASELPGLALVNYLKAYDYVDRALKVYNSFDPITEADRKEIKGLTDLRTSSWARIFKIGEDQQTEGNTKEALDIYEQVLKLDPNRSEPL